MASYFSEVEEFDDGLEFERRSDLGPSEADHYRAAGHDGVAPAWTGSIGTRRGADGHFSPYFNRQYELQRHEDELDDLYHHSDHQQLRKDTGRPHSGAATVPVDHWSASSRISGLRISPVVVTNTSRQFLGRNAPRTGSEARQHVMPEMRVTQDDRRMSGRASEIPTGGLRNASAASAAARMSASVSSSPVIRDPASVSAPASVVGLPAVRPIANASRNIKFGMLQPHFERPLQEAALKFGVCTTLLKKICRKNGIANWPFRKICGLRKSIASMEKQVQYFDGEQKQAYAEQLRKLQVELEAYRRIGMAPTPEFIQLMDEEEEEQQQRERERDEDAHSGDEVAADSENRAGIDTEEEEDDEMVARADREEKQQRETERVSPLQHPEPHIPDSPPSKIRTSKSRSQSSSSTHSVHYSRPNSYQEYQEARPSTSGSRYDEHLHHDRVHSRPPDVVARGYTPDRHAYDDRHRHQYQSEHRPQRYHLHEHQQQQQHHEHWHHHHHHHTPPPRSRPHPQGMSTIGIHQHALPSIGSLLYRQGRNPATPSDARDDHSRRYYERRGDLQ
jgi:hypothetical protein